MKFQLTSEFNLFQAVTQTKPNHLPRVQGILEGGGGVDPTYPIDLPFGILCEIHWKLLKG